MILRDNLVVVLCRPQRNVNVAASVRAMRNMGLRSLRLVQPAAYDPADITWAAHRCDEIVAATRVFADLDAALADAVCVAGTTARPRAAAPPPLTPRAAAPELLARAAHGTVALLFGPEDNGLTNAELDRCTLTVSIPTAPDYPSLNLAQAVLLLGYELWLADARPPDPPPASPPANAAQLERLFAEAERALWAIEFFKSGRSETVMRALRSLLHRAAPDAREARLLAAICAELPAFLRRKGLPAAASTDPPAGSPDGAQARDELQLPPDTPGMT